jgi:N4-gp56 family major capsid protein
MSTANYQNWPNNNANTQYLLTKEMLDRADAFERIGIACEEQTLQPNSGNSIVVGRWVNPAVDTTPEAEGLSPATRALQAEDFSGTLKRYSVAFGASRQNIDLHPRNWVKGMGDVLNTYVASVRERIKYLAALSTTNVIFNSSAHSGRGDVNGPITIGRLQRMIAGIEAAKGRTMTKESAGSTKVGSSPTEAGFVCFTHTDCHPDIRALPGFTAKAEMVGTYPEGTFGAVDNIIFVTSPEFVPFKGEGAATSTMRSTNGNTDVYPYVVTAKGSLVSVKLAGAGKAGYGNGKAMIYDGGDKSDPTNARCVVAAAWYDLCISVSDDWRGVIECGATANPA